MALLALPIASAAAQRTSLPRHMTTADVAAAATPATVTILALGTADDTLALGSGFIIRESGVIVTNFHVLRGAANAVVLLASKERFDRVTVLDADSTLDLALLKIPGAGLPTLPTRTTTPRVGEKVIAIGSPLGLAQTVSEGILSATRMAAGHELVQITAPISHGSSGGAVLDERGRVFAISTSLLSEGQALNFAIPVRYALGLLGDNPQPRSIAEVFHPATVMQAGAPAEPTAPAKGRAVTPRASVTGTYAIEQRITSSDGTKAARQIGALISTDHVALLVLATVLGPDSLAPTRIYNIERWSTAPNGNVVLVAGGAAWDGYQTNDGGFVARGGYAGREGTALYSMTAVPSAFPISRPDGVYGATSRTRYRTANGVFAPDFFDWRGELAVAFAHDTMYAALYLTNDRGGFVYFRAHGPLDNHEQFDLRNTNNAHLRGSVRNGVIVATWEDVRSNGGAFVGTFNAERK